MRFDNSENLTAHTVINTYTKNELMQILEEYADFPSNLNTTKFVEYIVQKRPIDTCENLKKICLNFYRNLSYKRAIQNITRIFQALRIEVNNEYENIKIGLENALSVIECEGKIFTITYHSGEDRIVKNIFNKYKLLNENNKKFKIVNKKVIKPKYKEQKSNSNSRSAKLRIIERIL
jgi:16S rRNA (cytosine1402-N4)-methyltransferase